MGGGGCTLVLLLLLALLPLPLHLIALLEGSQPLPHRGVVPGAQELIHVVEQQARVRRGVARGAGVERRGLGVVAIHVRIPAMLGVHGEGPGHNGYGSAAPQGVGEEERLQGRKELLQGVLPPGRALRAGPGGGHGVNVKGSHAL